jgi:hypothetical protein
LQAFDDAWAEYDRSLGRDQRGDFVRKMLADIVISLARRGPVKDAWSLKEDAMKELSSTYRIPPPWLP